MAKNIVVGQSGGPTAAINASLLGVLRGAKEAGYDNIYGMHNGIEGLLKEDLISLKDRIPTKEEEEVLRQTPSAYLGSCRYKLPSMEEGKEVYEKIFSILEKYEISCLIYIGGNDSMDTILKLSACGEEKQSPIRFIGVPKTIDNDLAQTDHTPGYGSAAKYVAASLKEVICDNQVYDMESVTVVEIMGRNAGWLTAAASLARGEDCDGPDLIYLPERTFSKKKFLEKINELRKKKKAIVVAVSESLKDEEGRFICEETLSQTDADAFGHQILTGTALYLSELIHKELKMKTRGIVFNTLQRCAAHFTSLTDLKEGEEAGRGAVLAAEKGESGKMMIFTRLSDDPYQMELSTYPIEKVANEEKTVPDAWITEDGTDVTEEFVRYARPLIEGEVSLITHNGLPKHIRL